MDFIDKIFVYCYNAANNMSYAKIDKDIVRALETNELSATGIARRSRYGRTT